MSKCRRLFWQIACTKIQSIIRHYHHSWSDEGRTIQRCYKTSRKDLTGLPACLSVCLSLALSMWPPTLVLSWFLNGVTRAVCQSCESRNSPVDTTKYFEYDLGRREFLPVREHDLFMKNRMKIKFLNGLVNVTVLFTSGEGNATCEMCDSFFFFARRTLRQNLRISRK